MSQKTNKRKKRQRLARRHERDSSDSDYYIRINKSLLGRFLLKGTLPWDTLFSAESDITFVVSNFLASIYFFKQQVQASHRIS